MKSTRTLSRRAWMGLAALGMQHPSFLSIAMADTAAPPELLEALPLVRLKGVGVMRFFGLRVYEARLWVTPGFDAEGYAHHPFGLELVYARRLEGQAIAERSVAEMRRVGSFDDEKAKVWMALMTRAFPDVAAHDRLVGLHDSRGEVHFFYNGRLTAKISDPEYTRLFFGIWLSRQTSAPALREALLGLGR